MWLDLISFTYKNSVYHSARIRGTERYLPWHEIRLLITFYED